LLNAHQAAADGNVVLQVNAFLEAQREAVAEPFAVLIDQQDTEHLVIDDAVQKFGDAFQQLIDVQDRCQLA
jgi:hypothetical protein